jgi:hypothetical protein
MASVAVVRASLVSAITTAPPLVAKVEYALETEATCASQMMSAPSDAQPVTDVVRMRVVVAPVVLIAVCQFAARTTHVQDLSFRDLC